MFELLPGKELFEEIVAREYTVKLVLAMVSIRFWKVLDTSTSMTLSTEISSLKTLCRKVDARVADFGLAMEV